jgi:glycine cleavage system H protein
VSVPTELGYTAKHEWVVIEDGVATVGITSFAAESLGDIVFVEAPEVGSEVSAGEPCGEVVEVNEALEDAPESVNSDPFGTGWLFRARVSEEPSDLLSAEEYTKLTEGEE